MRKDEVLEQLCDERSEEQSECCLFERVC